LRLLSLWCRNALRCRQYPWLFLLRADFWIDPFGCDVYDERAVLIQYAGPFISQSLLADVSPADYRE